MDQLEFQQEVMRVFTLPDSIIRLRREDTSLKYYLNRKFPTVRCADTYHECDYGIQLIFPEKYIDEENIHVIRNHDMFKGLLEASEFIKTLYVNVHSWMKHFLYDPSIKFDVFSSYEI